jgi:1-acyl-sn-glycerol-3-phosphate acyltransferase
MSEAPSTPSKVTLAPIFNSEPPRPGLFSRWFPSFMFYSRIAGTICSAARGVKAGHTDAELYIESSFGISRAVNSVGGRIIVENAEVLAGLKGPCIIAANHMSSLETMAIQGIVMPIIPMTIVAKASLMKYPGLKISLKASNPIIVGRTNAREDLRIMMTEAHDRISRGISIVVFPQTTRTTEFSPERFNSIGAKLAKREGVPLVPLALKTDFWGYGKIVKDLGRIDPKKAVRYRFGEPLDAAADEREAHRKCVEFIGNTLIEWRGKPDQ